MIRENLNEKEKAMLLKEWEKFVKERKGVAKKGLDKKGYKEKSHNEWPHYEDPNLPTPGVKEVYRPVDPPK